jgi:hypothetical protein
MQLQRGRAEGGGGGWRAALRLCSSSGGVGARRAPECQMPSMRRPSSMGDSAPAMPRVRS